MPLTGLGIPDHPISFHRDPYHSTGTKESSFCFNSWKPRKWFKKSHNLINDAKRQGVSIDWTDMRASEDFTVLQCWVSNSYILKNLRISVLTAFLPIVQDPSFFVCVIIELL